MTKHSNFSVPCGADLVGSIDLPCFFRLKDCRCELCCVNAAHADPNLLYGGDGGWAQDLLLPSAVHCLFHGNSSGYSLGNNFGFDSAVIGWLVYFKPVVLV